ncbi:mechanosensitive ion channel family protein [Neisseria montereyensis]|uniref:Small-conductance mechanosensitive channel n=1 Tax=Neisseria montereyensis TaxID=2973938 RepID=A0ABT2F9U2_9NEIS|nr:mechanosensitive ion channel [Neisseria montereyensis]MCS4532898.1 mechanosensitive ion channel [Neisseria montereyensis]
MDTEQVLEQAVNHVPYGVMTAEVQSMVAAFWARVPYMLTALAVFIIFWFVSRLFKLTVRKLLAKRLAERMNLLLVLQRIGAALIVFSGFLAAMMIALPDFTPTKLISTLGIGSVAIGFAFKDIFQNLLSGILLLLSEPFQIGDRIVSGDFEGKVENIEIRATTLRTSNGRRIVIPNSQLFTSPVTVNTSGRRYRQSTTLTLPSGRDPEQVKQDILKVLKERCQNIEDPEVVMTALSDTAATLELYWWAQGYGDDHHVTDQVLSCVRPLLMPPTEA